MNYFDPTPNTQVILLLCAPLDGGREREIRTLTLGEYNKLAGWLRDAELDLNDLMHGEAYDRLDEGCKAGIEPARIRSLIDRSTALAFVLDKWRNAGFWVIGRADERYPSRLRERLKRQAPTLVFGVGNSDLLACGGIAVVGSRDADNDSLMFANRFGQACAADEVQIISGGARGIDATAALGALREGGTALHVLPSGIEHDSRASDYREFLRDGRLALISPFVPTARFSVGAAMGRNKLIYSLADEAVVVSSGTRGGTWQGAEENLAKSWVPMYVRNGSGTPEGNRCLLQGGAQLLHPNAFATRNHICAMLEAEAEPDGVDEPLRPHIAESPQAGESSAAAYPSILPAPGASSPEHEMFEYVWPRIETELSTPRSATELATRIGVRKAQIDDWIKLALEQHLIDLSAKGKKKFFTLRKSPANSAQIALPLT